MRTHHTLHPLAAFPVWSAGFVSDTRFVLGGGGGAGRTGVKNKLRLYEAESRGSIINLVDESELEKDEDAPMSLAVQLLDGALVCGVNSSLENMEKGVNENCRLYFIQDNKLRLERKKQTIPRGNSETYQNVTAFSTDYSLVAVGNSDDTVHILSYPALAAVALPFKIPSGKLYGIDFSESSLLVTTDTVLYFVSLPLNLIAKSRAEDGDHLTIELPQLEISHQMPLPSRIALGAGSDSSIRTFRAGRFNPQNPKTLYTVINSAPPPGRGRTKAERKSHIVRWELVSNDGKDTWEVRKVKDVGKRAITVFDISRNGKLVAYGASDSSVGIVDARTLSPMLTILKSHDFPPTTLQFNPGSTLLVSGSADASLRVIVVPESFSSSSTLHVVLFILALLVVLGAVLVIRV